MYEHRGEPPWLRNVDPEAVLVESVETLKRNNVVNVDVKYPQIRSKKLQDMYQSSMHECARN
jgi:hypothetical protein